MEVKLNVKASKTCVTIPLGTGNCVCIAKEITVGQSSSTYEIVCIII